MPQFLEKKLKTEARKKGFTGRRAARYVYGAMNNMGAMQGNKETAKGAEMQRKHSRKVANQHIESETHAYDFRDHLSKPNARRRNR